jgi:hypothetical protein
LALVKTGGAHRRIDPCCQLGHDWEYARTARKARMTDASTLIAATPTTPRIVNVKAATARI